MTSLAPASRWRVDMPWWLLLISGLAGIILGFAIIAWPGRTLLVFAVLLGIYLMIFGAVRFAQAIVGDETAQRGLTALAGGLGFVVGLVVIREPARSIAILVILLGLFWVISGLIETFTSITNSDMPHRGLAIFLGVLRFVTGLLVLAWPAITFLILAWLAGAYMILAGVLEIVLTFQLRKA